MRIVAIIPACEGSVTLPNKNIRVIHGKPLIWYVIKNAISCKYIDEVLVTTNSPEIVSIAGQMGVKTKLRDPNLCSKDVSVDAVIYDAVQELELNENDYVVTMQSISPTLHVETLNQAIEQCLDNNVDTMISVVRKQYYSWLKDDKSVVALYTERVNRHQLMPFYIETGAFLITKRKFVAVDTRIGNRVELYELNGDEAVDIDSFGDLKQAENVLSRKKTAFYVNGNNTIGLGHISRVLQIADELFTKPDIYFDSTKTDISVFGITTHNLCPVSGEEAFMQAVAQGQYDVVINDVLSTTEEYMKQLKACAPSTKFINFEDEGTGAVNADCVINALYETGIHENMYTGSLYYIVPKLFLLFEPIQIQETVSNVLITFGGADPNNYTEQVLEFITKPEYSDVHFYIVLGKAKQNVDKILQYNQYENIEVLHDIKNMPEIMMKCDIAITSRGRTGFELAVLGIPSISIAQNEREAMHDFMSEQNGFSYLGLKPATDVIEAEVKKFISFSKKERQQLQYKMLSNDLRDGRKHVLELIQKVTDNHR